MKKPMIIMLIGLAVLFGLVFIGHFARKLLVTHFIHNMQQQAVVISTAKVKQTDWSPKLEAVGSLTAVNGVNVSSEVTGMVVAINFQSGQMVQQGDVLVQLDDSTDQQTLNTNSAQLNLDKLNYNRQQELLKTSSTAQSDVDQANAKMLQSQAAVTTAQVYIDKKKIKAPFSGKIGITQVSLGQYLTPGQSIASLQALDPLYVDFALPEQYLPQLHVKQKVEVKVEAFPNQIFDGEIEAIDSNVDINTRSINVRATVPNDHMQLYPGIFAKVAVILPQQKNVLTIPQTAIAYSLYGDSVYVVEPGKDDAGNPVLHAVQRFVVLGEKRDNEVVVHSGLKLGEEVVASGQLKLQPNSVVTVNNNVQMK